MKDSFLRLLNAKLAICGITQRKLGDLWDYSTQNPALSVLLAAQEDRWQGRSTEGKCQFCEAHHAHWQNGDHTLYIYEYLRPH